MKWTFWVGQISNKWIYYAKGLIGKSTVNLDIQAQPFFLNIHLLMIFLFSSFSEIKWVLVNWKRDSQFWPYISGMFSLRVTQYQLLHLSMPCCKLQSCYFAYFEFFINCVLYFLSLSIFSFLNILLTIFASYVSTLGLTLLTPKGNE